MKKILYLMHVDWNWIKQRPHFLAEELSKRFDIVVVCKSARGRKNMVDNATSEFECISLPNISMQRFKPVRRLNRLLSQQTVMSAIRKAKPDYIWVTHPTMVDLLPRNLECKIIYDCMDDALGFKLMGDMNSARLLELEKRLIRESSHVFCSSAHLTEVISGREQCKSKTTLVRNAFDGKVFDVRQSSIDRRDGSAFRIGYYGTVAEWFDFEALGYCLEKVPELEFDIVGPLQNASPIKHDRLRLLGPIEHSELGGFARTCDCLIMPFQVTDLIRSVDPVKIYEYINFNKPIIAVEYDEIRRFEPFVSFYSGKEQLLAVIQDIMGNPGPKYSNEQRVQFLRENSWERRAEVIGTALNSDGLCLS